MNSPFLYAGLFGALIICIKYPFNFFWAHFDPYYHAVHSQSYFDSFSISYPTFTYFSEYPADPWLLYHLAVGGTWRLMNLVAEVSATTALVTFQIIASIALMGTLLILLKSFFELQYKDLKRFNPVWYAVFTAVVFVFFTGFSARAFFFERPHTVMILLVALGMIAIIKKKNFLLFLSCLIAPFTYSFSLFCFLPVATIAIGQIFTTKSLKSSDTLDRFIAASLFGFILGVILRPDTVGYIINGLIFHAFAIIQSVAWWVPGQIGDLAIPAEMLVMQEQPTLLYPVVMAFLLITLDLINRKSTDSRNTTDTHQKIVVNGFALMSLMLLFASLFVSRTVEYAVPYALITTIGLLPFIHNYFVLEIRANLKNNPSMALQKIAGRYNSLRNIFKAKRVKYPVLFLVVNIILVSGIYKYVNSKSVFLEGTTDHQAAGEFLSQHAGDRLILQSSFSTYPSLLHTAPTLNYSVGMDARMIYLYDPELSELYSGVFANGECFKTCKFTQEEALQELMKRYDIGHILVLKTDLVEGKKEFFDNHEKLSVVYSDQASDITIYAIATTK